MCCRDVFSSRRPHLEEPMLTHGSRLVALPVLVLVGAFAAARGADENPLIARVRAKVKDPAQTFVLLVPIKAKAGMGKALEEAFAPCVAASRKEAGCLAYDLVRDPDDPTAYLVYEKFKGVAALDDHLKQGHTVKLLKALEPILDGEIKSKVYVVPQ
jgi:quinol monooxygenase YgiN